MSNMGWDDQVIIRKTPNNAKDASSSGAINAARRAGKDIVVEKKFSAGSNKAAPDAKAAKLDRETEELSTPTVGLSVSKAIMKGRQDLGLTQKDLGVKINEKPNVIAEYESGKAIPSQQILGKLERALGVKLRGSNIGEKLGPKK